MCARACVCTCMNLCVRTWGCACVCMRECACACVCMCSRASVTDIVLPLEHFICMVNEVFNIF